MPLLDNPRHELFAQNIVTGKSATKAYISAGYSPNDAEVGASVLLTNPKVAARVAELRQLQAAKFIAGSVRDREHRLNLLDDMQGRMLRLIEARATHYIETMPDIPGGATGLLVKTVKGAAGSIVEQHEVDTGLVKVFLQTQQQAAIELGQWTEKRELTGPEGGPILLADAKIGRAHV